MILWVISLAWTLLGDPSAVLDVLSHAPAVKYWSFGKHCFAGMTGCQL